MIFVFCAIMFLDYFWIVGIQLVINMGALHTWI